MGLPAAPEARIFYQAALQRFEDARFLLNGDRTTAAMYLAGYSIECILKSLVFSVVPKKRHPIILGQFRGKRGHDFGWLLAEYLRHGGTSLPHRLTPHLTRANTWSTQMRYLPGAIIREDARAYFESAREIVRWADGRL